MFSDHPAGFVSIGEAIPDVILEIRYYSSFNFIGERIDGYEQPIALMTREAVSALKEASDEMVSRGYRLKIFDAYRPTESRGPFHALGKGRLRYPHETLLLSRPRQERTDPRRLHCRAFRPQPGSTVELTLFDMRTQKESDMGGPFDFFGELSHPDYPGITEEQHAHRMLLRDAMISHGFRPIDSEWWYFTLAGEPYPDKYFTFPVRR